MPTDPIIISDLVTIGIKHTSAFARRRVLLLALLASIRRHYGTSLRVIVADDSNGDESHRNQLRQQGVSVLVLQADSGLSFGRNELVRATQTPYVALIDDDLVFHTNTSLPVLVGALQANRRAILAGGCYVNVRAGTNASAHQVDCYNMRFQAAAGGAAMDMHQVVTASGGSSGCHRVDVTHNFFVARTEALRRFRWDPRQKMMEHESFFLQLHLHQQRVLACPSALVLHHAKSILTDKNYSRLSLRFKEQRFSQYLCKNYPEMARLTTPFAQWHCRMHTFCTPAWWAQFAFDGSSCSAMHYSTADDLSAVELPLVSPAIHTHLIRPPSASTSWAAHRTHGGAARARHYVPLIAVVLTRREHVALRQQQRATWLTYAWHQSHMSRDAVPWRFLFAMPRPAGDTNVASATNPPASPYAREPVTQLSSLPAPAEVPMGKLMGDSLILRSVPPDAHSTALLAIESMRWVHRHATFDALFLTDDTSIVHVGRLWGWLVQMASRHPAELGSTISSSNVSTLSTILVSGDQKGSDVLLGGDASVLAVDRFDVASLPADSMRSVGTVTAFGRREVGGTSYFMAVDPLARPDLDPVIMRGHSLEDTPNQFRRLLASKSCYGPMGLPIGCPKTKGAGGFELSNRPWRDAPLDDVQALALTPVTNKQVMNHLGRSKAAKALAAGADTARLV